MGMTPVFDLTSFVRAAYVILWRERAYLMRIMVVPVLISTLNMGLVQILEPDISPLRRGLFMLPAMGAEAWMVAQFLRTLLTGERWPIAVPAVVLAGGPLPSWLRGRVRGLLSAMVAYVLTTLVITAAGGAVVGLLPPDFSPAAGVSAPPQALPPGVSLLMMLLLFIGVTQFRFFWLYIPLVINVPLRRYRAVTQPWSFRFQLLGLWLVVILPLMGLVALVLSILLPLASAQGPLAFIAFLMATCLNAGVQALMAVAGSVVVALAVVPFLTGKNHVG